MDWKRTWLSFLVMATFTINIFLRTPKHSVNLFTHSFYKYYFINALNWDNRNNIVLFRISIWNVRINDWGTQYSCFSSRLDFEPLKEKVRPLYVCSGNKVRPLLPIPRKADPLRRQSREGLQRQEAAAGERITHEYQDYHQRICPAEPAHPREGSENIGTRGPTGCHRRSKGAVPPSKRILQK